MGGALPPTGKALGFSSYVFLHAGETGDGPVPGLSWAGPGPIDTSVSDIGVNPGAEGRTSGQFFCPPPKAVRQH